MVDNLAEEVDECPLSRGCYVLFGTIGSEVSIIRSSRVSAIQGFLKSMEKRLGLSELSIMSWMSAVEGCPLSAHAEITSLYKDATTLSTRL